MAKKIVIHLNHESLKYSLAQANLKKIHTKWVNLIEYFLYVIKYKKGKQNIAADVLFLLKTTLPSCLDFHVLGPDEITDLYPPPYYLSNL
jgi:hypothetical protein